MSIQSDIEMLSLKHWNIMLKSTNYRKTMPLIFSTNIKYLKNTGTTRNVAPIRYS